MKKIAVFNYEYASFACNSPKASIEELNVIVSEFYQMLNRQDSGVPILHF